LSKRVGLIFGLFFLAFLFFMSFVAVAEDWQPISPDDLKMTSEPAAPGAPAIYLYRQVDRDDTNNNPHEFNYARIKILTEEGRKYADVEIPFYKKEGSISSFRARTIQPDGRITNFEGKPFEKTIVKARGVKVLAKTFTLPDVQVGSIIEYRYSVDLNSEFVFDSKWILSSELFTRYAKFSLKPNQYFGVSWRWPSGLPQGTKPPQNERGVVRLESRNIPAFQVEDYMPPEDEMKFRVEFVYQEGTPEKDPAKFWKQDGKKRFDRFNGFVNKRGVMEQAVAQIVTPADAPEVKLQKIYARVQQVRNTSYEREKTEQEQKRDKQKEAGNVEEVWKSGAGDGRQINWLFIGLARAAGFEAYPVYICSRGKRFFNKELMDANQLNGDIVLVKLNGKNVWLDPGSKFASYGYLPWQETGVSGLLVNKDGGEWVQTEMPTSASSKIERRAKLSLSEDGSLDGTLAVTYTGLEALWLRMEQRDEDDRARKTTLEDQVKEWVPTGIEVELTNKPDWNSSSPTLVAEFTLKVPGWVSSAGRRGLLPIGIFGSAEKHTFEHGERVYPIYFHYPYIKTDDITIVFPQGWKVASVPEPVDIDAKAMAFVAKAEDDKGTLHITRTLRSDILTLDLKYYDNLRHIFQLIRSGDERQVVVQPGF
jgi:hypothetical protein